MFSEHSAWAKTSHDKNQNYTHSSLRGGTDFTTSTGRLSFPATVEVRVNFEECVINLYHRLGSMDRA